MGHRPGDHVVYRPRPLSNLKRARYSPGSFIGVPTGDSLAARVARYSLMAAILALTTAALWPLRESAGLLNIGLVYLVEIIGVTVFLGRRAGIVASLLGFALLVYFMVPPYLTFVIADFHNILALFVFLGVSLLISWLIATAQEQARQAHLRAEDIARLYELSQSIIGAQSAADILSAVTRKVHEVFEPQSCWILLPDTEGQAKAGTAASTLKVAAQAPSDAPPPDRNEMSLAIWAFEHGREIGRDGTAPGGRRGSHSDNGAGEPSTARSMLNARQPSLTDQSASHTTFVPLQAAQRVIGVLGVVGNKGKRPFTHAERTMLATFADQAGVALERLYLLSEAERAELLARTDNLKSALMSAVSHDLRTPLASIIASVTSLMEPDIEWDEDTRRDFLQGIYDEATRLNRLVGNLLDMSRIEGGALKPEKDWYSIGEVIESVVQRLEPSANEHPLSVEMEPDLPLLLLDFAQVYQVITNILENALKHTPPGTRIEVRAGKTGDTIVVDIQDNGPGVPREHLPHLFDKFYQVEKGEHNGTGLGLAIARGLVEAHGGHITASDRPGGGLQIRFTLPLTPDSAARSGEVPTHQEPHAVSATQDARGDSNA